MAVINTGIVERTIVGVNESDLFLDSEATSVTTNTGIVERSIVGVHDANFVHPLGDEEILNGDFSNGSTDWTLGSQFSIGNNKAIYDNSGSGTLIQSFNWQGGKTYKVTFDIGDFTTNHRFDVYSGATFIKTSTIESNKSYTIYFNGDGGTILRFRGLTTESFSITNISVKEMLVNRESTATNTGIVERAITGSNESELWLDAESTSVVNNTGIVERPITGVNESDALFPDNTDSTVVNISDTIIPLLTALEARATTFENREGTQNILINLEKC